LFEHILQYVEGRSLAWDCATGNGQAAVALAAYFEKVFASDSSASQIAHAVHRENIIYSVANAEDSGFPDKSFDLVTVAQAYHWLDAAAFSKEVKRVAKPGAVIAIWGYNIPASDNIPLNEQIRYFYKNVVGKYWDKERKYIDESYTTVEFDFLELPPQIFSIEVEWTLDHLAGYLNTWSSVKHYRNAEGRSPVAEFIPRLQEEWPEETPLSFKFPVFMRLGRVP